LTIIYLNALS